MPPPMRPASEARHSGVMPRAPPVTRSTSSFVTGVRVDRVHGGVEEVGAQRRVALAGGVVADLAQREVGAQ